MMQPNNTVSVNGCAFYAPIQTHSTASAVIVSSTSSVSASSFYTSISQDYDEKQCFKHKEHKMYKALQVACPCARSVPLLIQDKTGYQVRLYENDIVFLDNEGKCQGSLADCFNLVKQQTKIIKKLENQVKILKRRIEK